MRFGSFKGKVTVFFMICYVIFLNLTLTLFIIRIRIRVNLLNSALNVDCLNRKIV